MLTTPTLMAALTLTILVEVAVTYLAFDVKRQDLIIVVLAQTLTNPAVNVANAWLLQMQLPLPYPLAAAMLELGAVVAEWLVYQAFKVCERPFVASLAANATSFVLGLCLNTTLKAITY